MLRVVLHSPPGARQAAAARCSHSCGSCTEAGSESIHCTVCGEQDPETVREIPMTEHSFGEDGKCEACGYILGDVNDDGELDTKDLVRLMKYLASDGNDESIVATVPDVNRDGSVDTRDLVRLMKMLAEG